MTKTIKIFSIVSTIILLFFIMPVQTQAFDGFDEIKSKSDQWINKGKNAGYISDSDISKVMLPIGRFLVAVGVIAVIGSTIFLGIKYMSAQDPSTQAKVKQSLIGLVVAAIIIFGAYGIWRLVYNFMDGIF